MKGLIFGPVDKNLNELWFCCPVLYRKAWDKAYAQTSDYQRIYPKIAKKTRGATTAYELEVTDNDLHHDLAASTASSTRITLGTATTVQT